VLSGDHQIIPDIVAASAVFVPVGEFLCNVCVFGRGGP
jgi:hypothetical protein